MNTILNKLIIFFGIILLVSLASNIYAGEIKQSARDHYAIGNLSSNPGDFTDENVLRKNIDDKNRFESKKDMDKNQDLNLSNEYKRVVFKGHGTTSVKQDSKCFGKC
ncbi:MAG: hypothetical protein K9L30_16200 [Desulfobacterales bacterium]|nr:hypothetical protein [Desulfobacterales bacterium]